MTQESNDSGVQSTVQERLKVVRQDPADSGATSEKSFVAVLLLLLLLGAFGAHRFYVGKPVTAILFIFTLGGLGFWGLYDLIMIATGKFKDSSGLPIKP